jgi:dTDP-4-dehydrorhamnose reductase
MTVRRVAITGAGGQLGTELVRAFEAAGDQVLALARPEFDITRTADLERLAAWRPDVVVNAAAWTDVDACARDPKRAMQINGEAAGAVARAAAEADAVIVQISTNEVFDGTGALAYKEDDAPHPANPYGDSKLAGERAVVDANPRHLVVRTAWLYGPGERNFPGKIRSVAERMLAEQRPLRVVEDEWGNPTDVRWLAQAVRRLVNWALVGQVAFGFYHLAGQPPTSRLDWARSILRDSPVAIEPMRLDEYRRDSRVPARAVLDVSRAAALGIEPIDWRSAFLASPDTPERVLPDIAESVSKRDPWPPAREPTDEGN